MMQETSMRSANAPAFQRSGCPSTIRVLVVHHTIGHFEIALSFIAQLRELYDIDLWSNSLDVRDRRTVVAMCGVAEFNRDKEYDVSVLITPNVPWNDVEPAVLAIMQNKPMIALTHDFVGLLPFGNFYVTSCAPTPATFVTVGFDLSHMRRPIASGERHFATTGNVWPVRGYGKIGTILENCPGARFHIIGATSGSPDPAVMTAGVLTSDQVKFHENLDEIPFYMEAASTHFIVPLIDPTSFPRYFESCFPSAILVGFSHSLPFIAHRRLFDAYPIEGFCYDTDDELAACVKAACSISEADYAAMVDRQRTSRQTLIKQFQVNFSLVLGRTGLLSTTCSLPPFRTLVAMSNMAWDPVAEVLTVDAAVLGKLLRPVLGWYPDSQLPGGSIELSRPQLASLLGPALANVAVDATWYREHYLQTDQTGIDAGTHFIREGYFKGYLPRPIQVVEEDYLQANSSSSASIGQDNQSTAQAHFEAVGASSLLRPYKGWLRTDLYASYEQLGKNSAAEQPPYAATSEFAPRRSSASVADKASSIDWTKASRDHLAKLFRHLDVDCVFDVGANIGSYANIIRYEVGYWGPMISVEPIPRLAEHLRKQAESDPNWHIVECALDSSERDTVLNVMLGDNFTSLRKPSHDDVAIFKGMNDIDFQLNVRTRTLKDLISEWQARLGFSRPFLKTDAQGHDLDVVMGAGDLIAGVVGLQSELQCRAMYEGAPKIDESLKYLMSLGFVLSTFVPSTDNSTHFPNLVDVDAIMFRPKR